MPFNMKKFIIPQNIALGLFVIFFTTFSSCKTKKITESPNTTNVEKITSEQELLKKIDASKQTYSNLNIKYAAKIKIGKDENSVRGKLKIRRDSCIWVAALPLGIEAARIIATQNEAGLINYLKKNYFLGGYDLLSSQIGYPVNYDMLQAALTGSALFIADKNSYQLEDDRKNGYYFSPYDRNTFEKITEGRANPTDGAPTVQALWFNESNSLVSKNVMYDVAGKRYLEVNYSNYQAVGKDMIPALVDIQIKTPKETAVFTIEYSKIDANVMEMDYPFNVPESYQKMQLK
jgi:hypothetical protein